MRLIPFGRCKACRAWQLKYDQEHLDWQFTGNRYLKEVADLKKRVMFLANEMEERAQVIRNG